MGSDCYNMNNKQNYGKNKIPFRTQLRYFFIRTAIYCLLSRDCMFSRQLKLKCSTRFEKNIRIDKDKSNRFCQMKCKEKRRSIFYFFLFQRLSSKRYIRMHLFCF